MRRGTGLNCLGAPQARPRPSSRFPGYPRRLKRLKRLKRRVAHWADSARPLPPGVVRHDWPRRPFGRPGPPRSGLSKNCALRVARFGRPCWRFPAAARDPSMRSHVWTFRANRACCVEPSLTLLSACGWWIGRPRHSPKPGGYGDRLRNAGRIRATPPPQGVCPCLSDHAPRFDKLTVRSNNPRFPWRGARVAKGGRL